MSIKTLGEEVQDLLDKGVTEASATKIAGKRHWDKVKGAYYKTLKMNKSKESLVAKYIK